MKKLQRIIIFLTLLCAINSTVRANAAFEQVGNILTLAPFGMLIVSLGMKDYEGAWQLTIASLATQGTIEVIKKGMEYTYNNGGGDSLLFAKRPCCADYKGMPSGHSGGAFSAAGYVYYRYGWKPALPMIAIGVITAASRVTARKHTILQTIVGGAIAWGWAYVFTTKYKPKSRFLITPEVSHDNLGGTFYGVNATYSW
ncbi:hypothetical protein CQA53_01965 [Helicobacter didelphidarum]|uniref:Phosphatidic acid phosphatase type 2/haloperoxidase domain-containing protein n=1 Tax=Helicobacter didelphidarum TaxID=2040648 RepID=A0A3D8IP81_9HELI|nr:phosphatase PAP2 family protein [Helicobacter didelphidarum]RDU67049.1 hypothetical protein CQA53_01965 [Helicobacter didelphidarum]